MAIPTAGRRVTSPGTEPDSPAQSQLKNYDQVCYGCPGPVLVKKLVGFLGLEPDSPGPVPVKTTTTKSAKVVRVHSQYKNCESTYDHYKT